MIASQKPADETASSFSLMSLLRDQRVLQAIWQIVFVIAVVFALSILWSNILQNLRANNLAPTFTFLESRAGFDIGEKPDWYSSTTATYGQAFLVGVINTLRIVVIGLVMATVLGVFFGIFLLSRNWLVKTISRAYVEILRNTPLLVQLIFFYFVVMFSLPREDVTLPQEGVFMMPLRLPTYLFLLGVVWFIGRKHAYPSRLQASAFAAIVLMEASIAIFGVSSLGVLYGIGFLLFIFAWFAPQQYGALLQGAAIVLLGQMVAGVFFDLLFFLSILPNQGAIVSEVFPLVFMSRTGFAFPEIVATARFAQWLAFIGIGVSLAIGIWIYSGRYTETTGRPIPRGLYALLAIFAFMAIGWGAIGLQPPQDIVPVNQDGETVLMPLEEAIENDLLTRQEELQYSTQPIQVILPSKPRFRFETGTVVSPEYMALLLGLVIYTSAFIAEIVRAGIQAVPYGQIEASRALGLSGSQTLIQVVLPQALRVIIPPMGNQYLNLSKNSSLAVAIAYADTYAVGQTIMNQSGQSVTGFALILLIYLTMSLLISVIMNFVNSRFQLVTR